MSPENDEMMDLALKHNFWTWSTQIKPEDILHIVKSEGVYFWDFAGKRYTDMNSTVMCTNIGHSNSHVQEAMCRQIMELPFAGPHMVTDIRAKLAAKIASLTPPGLDHILYTLGGSDANENAVKIARDYTGRTKILTRYRSYHGATMGAMALTGDRRRVHWEPAVMPGVVHFLDPYRYRSVLLRDTYELTDEQFVNAYLRHLEEIINYEGSDKIAAILLETVTGTNGIIVPPDGYLQGVRDICDKNGILLITDEVMCGFGRTGKWFAFEHWNVKPDLIKMAKGLTSGYAPLGVVAMKKEIAEYYNDRTFYGGLTYNGHPVSLAAAMAVIEVIENENLLENSTQRGKTLKRLLREMKEKHICVGDFRSIGLFGVLELVKDRETREPLMKRGEKGCTMKKVTKYLHDNGIYIKDNTHMLLVIPPLIITDEQLEEAFDVIDRSLDLADEDILTGRVS